MELTTLQDLLVEKIQDLYSAEQQITKALPKMVEAATSPDLKKAFQTHLRQTEEHIARLERIAEQLGEAPKGKMCKGMQGVIKEGQELMEEDASQEVLDAGLIAAAQGVEHYEMAGYGTARTYAEELGLNDISKMLQQTLDEEQQTDQLLTKLAESRINLKAKKAA